jgi:hypothetical protein
MTAVKRAEKLIRPAPAVFVHRELRRLRHEASGKAWEASDLVDLTALSSAIVYCDVVVTERVWTALAARDFEALHLVAIERMFASW